MSTSIVYIDMNIFNLSCPVIICASYLVQVVIDFLVYVFNRIFGFECEIVIVTFKNSDFL